MNRKVVVGESNYAEFEVLNDLLSAKGFQVTWLKNGRDVVSQFAQISPGLLILDALLPGMTGLKVTQAVKGTPEGKDVKVILMSSVYRQFKAQYETRAKIGVDAYTDKPANVAEVERLIEELMGPTPALDEFPPLEPVSAPGPVEAPAAEERGKPRGVVEGSLAETSLPKLIFSLLKHRRTGALRVDRESVSKVVFFRNGLPEFVTSNQSKDSLGRFLVQHRYINVAQYNASLEKMVDSGRNHGDVLLAMGALSPHDLYRGLQEHVFDKVLSIFAWDYGHYRFRPGQFEAGTGIAVNIDARRMIFQGIRRFYPLTRLESFFNDYKNRRLLAMDDIGTTADACGFGPAAGKFIKFINGRRTVGQIVARSNLSLTETFQILYVLIVMEAVRFRGDADASERTPEAQREFLDRQRERRTEMREEDARNRKYETEVRRAWDAMHDQNHYERFGLSRHATADDVKLAYFRMAQKYRDHKLYQAAEPEVRRMADDLFESLTEGYEVLLVPDRRRDYDRRLDEEAAQPSGAASLEASLASVSEAEFAPSEDTAAAQFEELLREDKTAAAADTAAADSDELGADLWGIDQEIAAAEPEETDVFAEGVSEEGEDSGAVTMDMGNLLKAELAFQEGEDAMREDDFEGAVHAFGEALAIAPNEAEYHACLGWARFRRSPDDTAETQSARESLERAVAMNPGLDSAHYYLGMIALRAGDRTRAKNEFTRAIQLNPDNEPAARAIKELDGG